MANETALTYGKSGGTYGSTENTSGAKSTAGNQNQSGSQTQTQNTSGNQSQTVSMQNMTNTALSALDSLINQLSGRIDRNTAEAKLAAIGIKKPVNKAYDMQWNGGDSGAFQNAVTAAGHQYIIDLAAYEQQVQIAMAGDPNNAGTPEIKEQKQNIDQEIATVRNAREGYDKESAFADSATLINNATRQMLEKLLPDINATVEGSGTSGGAVAGLLKNDAAARAAESAASLGINSAIEYGKIFDDQSQIISGLIDKSPVAMNALLSALGVAKGSISAGTQVTNTSGSQTTTTNSNQNTSSNANEANTASGSKVVKPLPNSTTDNNQTSVFGNYTFPQ